MSYDTNTHEPYDQMLKWGLPPIPHAVSERAACRKAVATGKVSPDTWFPEPGETDKLETAHAICASCPVRNACFEWSLRFPNHVVTGIWGGRGTRARQTARTQRKKGRAA